MNVATEVRRIGTRPDEHVGGDVWMPCESCGGTAIDVGRSGEFQGGESCEVCGGAGGMFVSARVSVEPASRGAPREIRATVYVSDWAYERWFGRR